MGENHKIGIYCYKGICPGEFERSAAFREKMNKELEKDGLRWVSDDDVKGNITNQPDQGEMVYIATGKNADPKLSIPAFDRYFRSYEDRLKKLTDQYEPVRTETRFNGITYPESERYIYQRTVREFVDKIEPLIDELYILQTNPGLIATRHATFKAFAFDTVWEKGAKLLAYDLTGECPSFFENEIGETCNIFPVPPDGPSINAMMPYDVTEEEWAFVDMACKSLGGEHPEALRPDTVVEWKNGKPVALFEALRINAAMMKTAEDDLVAYAEFQNEKERLIEALYKEIVVTYLPKHPVFMETCSRLAMELKRLAAMVRDINPDLSRQFETAAIYFEQGDLASATEAMRWSIKGKDGPFFEVTAGSESYWAGPKHWAWSAVGEYVTDTQKRLEKYLGPMSRVSDNNLLTEGIVFEKVVNIISYGGALASPDGTTAGWNKFNYPFPGLTNHDYILAQNVLEIYDTGSGIFKNALFAGHAGLLTPFGMYGYVAAHENGHSLLGGDDVTISSGQHFGESAKALFGTYWLWYKETRADLHVATALENILIEHGDEALQDVKEIFFNYIYFTIRVDVSENSLFSDIEPHMASALIRNGWWLKSGLYRLEGEGATRKLVFNISEPDKITTAELLYWIGVTRDMDLMVNKMIEEGDLEGYKRLVSELAAEVPKDFSDFVVEKKKLIKSPDRTVIKKSLDFRLAE